MIESNRIGEADFVGRERELEILLELLAEAMDGCGRIVVISGDAGIGKSRLVTHFLGSLSEKLPLAVLSGRCSKQIRTAYLPFLDAFNAYFGNKKSGREIENVLNRAADAPSEQKNQALQAVMDALAVVTQDKVVVLFVEDLEWADSASLEILNNLSGWIVKRPVLVLATFGDMEAAQDFLMLAQGNLKASEIKLTGLSQKQVKMLADQMANSNVSPDFVEALHKTSQGNPLYIIEYLKTVLEKNSAATLNETQIPRSIDEAILKRTQILSMEQKKLLQAASVIGEHFESVEAAALVGQNISAASNDLATSSIVIQDGSGYRFSHLKTQEAIYSSISVEERKLIHAKLAEQIENATKEPSAKQRSLLAYHYLQADNREKALQYMAANEGAPTVPDLFDVTTELTNVYMTPKAADSGVTQHKEALRRILQTLALCEQANMPKRLSTLAAASLICIECGLFDQAAALSEEATGLIHSLEPQNRSTVEAWNGWMQSFIVETRVLDVVFTKIYDRLEFTLLPDIELKGEAREELSSAVDLCLRALQKAEKQPKSIHNLLCGSLTRMYSFLGDAEKAAVYFGKLKNTSVGAESGLPFEVCLSAFSKAVRDMVNKQWSEANRSYQEAIQSYSSRPDSSIEAMVRQWFCVSLLQQRKFDTGMQELAKARKALNSLDTHFSSPDIQVSIEVPPKVQPDHEFTLKLYLVNAAKAAAHLKEANHLVPAGFKIVATNPQLNLKDETAELDDKIGACKYATFTFTAKALSAGNFEFKPEITYQDNGDLTLSSHAEPITLLVEAARPTSATSTTATVITPTVKTEALPSKAADTDVFDVFLCYKKSSAKDFADHLKASLEELGLHTFQDWRDIPQVVEGEEGWSKIRDKALLESKYFILIMTPGFHLSREVVKEIAMAHKQPNKIFVFFRHRNMGRKIVVNLGTEILDIGKLEQVSFESKEELLRLAVKILPCEKPS